MDYILDAHGQMLLSQYRERLHAYRLMEQQVCGLLQQALQQQGICVNALEHRVKAEDSLAGKLELKGAKYSSLEDITDILGIRIITFYTDDVDKVAAIVKGIFDVDWNNSVDKRKMHQLNSFGYNSLHYVCRMPKKAYFDPEMPELNEYRFEIQMRTALQHVWSTIEHDIGYKSSVKIPQEYRRQFSRLSGMLELIDDEFSRLRTTLNDYRRQMQSLVASGRLDEVPLDHEAFRSYLDTRPFDKLNRHIAASNQAEIFPASLMPFLPVLQFLGMETLGDVQQFVFDNYDDAYQLAISQLAFTDLDIVSENVGILNLCIVRLLKNGGRRAELTELYRLLNERRQDNEALADMTLEQASTLAFMKKNG